MFCVFFSILLLALSVQCESPLIRQTTNGPVEGIEKTSSLGQKFYAFRGIPFAEPPITGQDPYTGEQVDRRFKPPVPLKRRWTEPLKVQNDGKWCIQTTLQGEIMSESAPISEDCLFLNIYIPANGSKNKTVLVYIHGGGFMNGHGTDKVAGPDFLLVSDNIVVTIQYRLAIFGFLNLNDDVYTGNMGLKDQQLALKWIYENIEQFSGKRDEILLFGLSAGGASVHYHMANEISRKYFNRAFAISSTVFSSYAMRRADHVQEVRKCLKINDMNRLTEYLKTANSSVLAACYPWIFPGKLEITWAPTIENPRAPNAFLTQLVEEIYNSDAAPKMDAMFNFAAQEYIVFEANLLDSTEPLIKPDWRETNIELPFEGFTKDAYPKEYAKSVEKLRIAYFSDRSSIDAIRRSNIALKSDLYLSDGILKAVALQANANNKNGTKNTFLYRFSAKADINFGDMVNQRNLGAASHSDDICYIFHCHLFDQFGIYDKHLEQKDMNYDIIMRLTKIITNFARTGDPSIEGDTPFKSSRSSDEIFCQEFSNDPKTQTITDIKDQLHYKVWRQIEEIYNSLNIFRNHNQ